LDRLIIGDKLYTIISKLFGRLIIGDQLYTIIQNYLDRLIIGDKLYTIILARLIIGDRSFLVVIVIGNSEVFQGYLYPWPWGHQEHRNFLLQAFEYKQVRVNI